MHGGPLCPTAYLIIGRGTGTETCEMGSVFPPDDLWIGLDTYTNCIVIYDSLLKV